MSYILDGSTITTEKNSIVTSDEKHFEFDNNTKSFYSNALNYIEITIIHSKNEELIEWFNQTLDEWNNSLNFIECEIKINLDVYKKMRPIGITKNEYSSQLYFVELI